ncbi:M55 family metallopeptidase [Candidatus Dependentiae bacterium]|nr:M55 family metallopeptidase [Candidatus Dependentiae bacterium]
MKIFISVDAEGICGVSSWHETIPKDPDYNRFRELVTDEVNVVCSAIREVSPRAEIVVCDSHAMGENLFVNKLIKDIYLVRGFPRQYYMMEGLDSSFDGVIFLGYHAMIGSLRGGMDHSYSSSTVYSIKVNGKEYGETDLNAVFAGYYKVPLLLVSGDDVLIKDIKKRYKQVTIVLTKKGISRFSSKSLPLNKVHSDLRIKTITAINNIKKSKPIFITPEYRVEIKFNNTVQADVVSLLPQLKRIDGRTIKFKISDYRDFYSMFMAIILLAATTKTMG